MGEKDCTVFYIKWTEYDFCGSFIYPIRFILFGRLFRLLSRRVAETSVRRPRRHAGMRWQGFGRGKKMSGIWPEWLKEWKCY